MLVVRQLNKLSTMSGLASKVFKEHLMFNIVVALFLVELKISLQMRSQNSSIRVSIVLALSKCSRDLVLRRRRDGKEIRNLILKNSNKSEFHQHHRLSNLIKVMSLCI